MADGLPCSPNDWPGQQQFNRMAQERMLALDSRIAAAEADLATLEADIAAAEADLASLETTITDCCS